MRKPDWAISRLWVAGRKAVLEQISSVKLVLLVTSIENFRWLFWRRVGFALVAVVTFVEAAGEFELALRVQ